jgi:F0F1-type ATP synthase epsilon subunit
MPNRKEKILTKIVTPTGVFFEEHVKFVTVKIAMGYATFLPEHMPVVSYIQPSVLTINIDGKTNKVAAILDGVISVFPTHIQIISNRVV